MSFKRRTFLKTTAAGALGTSAVASNAATTDDTAANTDAPSTGIYEDIVIHPKGREVPVRTDQVSYSRAAGGMVSTNDPAATQAGLEVLNDGGNAIDAAVAASLALCVTDTRSISLGGGGSTMVYSADEDSTYSVNHQMRAAGAARPELFRGADGEPLSLEETYDRGLAFGVPGLVKGFDVLLERWGTRGFAGVTDPAIDLAANGYLIEAEETGRALQEYGQNFGEAARDVFFRNGEPYQVGERLVQEDLARSLRLIKNNGAEAFYEGEIADAIAETIQDRGGIVTREDLAQYSVTVDSPIRYEYNGHQIASPPTNNGYTIALVLKLLDEFNLGKHEIRSADKYERFLDALRIAYAIVPEYVSDPEFVDVPREGLLSEDFIAQRRELMNLGEAATDIQPGNPWKFQPGSANQVSQNANSAESGALPSTSMNTTHVSAADSDGNMIAINQTLDTGFQGGLVVPDYGIFLSTGQGYILSYYGPEGIHPHKRFMWGSSTIVFQDGKPLMCLGSPGELAAAVSSVILHTLEYDMTLPEAIAVSRVGGYYSTDLEISWETGVPAEAREALAQRGFEIPEEWIDIGNVNAVWRDNINKDDVADKYVGAADPRRNGTAIGAPADLDKS